MKTKIDALNKLNASAPEILGEINAMLAPYAGKKVIVQKPWRTWGKRLQEQLNALHEKHRSNQIRMVFHFSERSIWCDIDTTIPCGPYSVEYVKQSFNVARVLDGDLVEMTQPESLNFRSDYTEEEIRQKMDKLKELQDLAYQIEGQLPAQLRR